jgi:hypothetical protein
MEINNPWVYFYGFTDTDKGFVIWYCKKSETSQLWVNQSK